MTAMRVLALTHTGENACIDTVTRAVEERGGSVFRLDTDRFPTEVRLTLRQESGVERATLRSPTDEVDLDEVTAIWHRRLRIGLGLPESMERQQREAAIKESRATLMGLVVSRDTFALDPLQRLRHAEHKPRQMVVAREVGLEVPRTLTTNDPEAVRGFHDACGGEIVGKMLSSFAIHEDGREKVVFTSRVRREDLAHLDALRWSPMTFQEIVPKALELRVTVVGERVFTASIDSQSVERARVDWRREGAAMVGDWKAYELPPQVERGVLALMDAYGLNYGAIDFVLTPDGRFVFLEINPAGEFFWLEVAPGLPISDAIADVLLGQAPRRG